MPELLTQLGPEWIVQLLKSQKKFSPRAVAPVDTTTAAAWFNARPGGRRCRQIKEVTLHWGKRIESAGREGGAHDAALGGIWALMRDGRDGHRGSATAMTALKNTFLMSVTDASRSGQARSESEAAAEWVRMVTLAIPKVMAEAGGDDGAEDPCTRHAQESAETVMALSYGMTDVGNAKRLIDRHGTDLRYLPQMGTWMVCTHPGNVWVEDSGDLQVLALAQETVAAMEAEERAYQNGEDESSNKKLQAFRKWQRNSANLGRLKSMISIAATLPGVSAAVEDVQQRPDRITCLNGTIELSETGATLRPTLREDFCTTIAPTNYHPEATSEHWEKFLEKSVPDPETRSWLQIAMGYSIFGGNKERILFMVKGPTASGKTAISILLQNVLGRYAGSFNLTMFRESQEEKARPDLVRALPRRILFASEASNGWVLFADTIKRMTGGDSINARQLYGRSYVEMQPMFTPWVMTNEYPFIKNIDLALWRRMIAVPFPNSTPESEQRASFIDDILKTSREAIFSWVIEGWRRYCQEGLLDMPTAVVDATMAMRGCLSTFDVFLADQCVFDPEESVLASDLRERYLVWVETNGEDADKMSANKLGRELSNRGYRQGKTHDQHHRTWCGLRLKHDGVSAT